MRNTAEEKEGKQRGREEQSLSPPFETAPLPHKHCHRQRLHR